MDFTSLVLAARPNIKPNSAKAYATSLKLLAPEGAADLDFLLDPEPILERLEKYKHTTRRNYLNAIIVPKVKEEPVPATREEKKEKKEKKVQYVLEESSSSSSEEEEEIVYVKRSKGQRKPKKKQGQKVVYLSSSSEEEDLAEHTHDYSQMLAPDPQLTSLYSFV